MPASVSLLCLPPFRLALQSRRQRAVFCIHDLLAPAPDDSRRDLDSTPSLSPSHLRAFCGRAAALSWACKPEEVKGERVLEAEQSASALASLVEDTEKARADLGRLETLEMEEQRALTQLKKDTQEV